MNQSVIGKTTWVHKTQFLGNLKTLANTIVIFRLIYFLPNKNWLTSLPIEFSERNVVLAWEKPCYSPTNLAEVVFLNAFMARYLSIRRALLSPFIIAIIEKEKICNWTWNLNTLIFRVYLLPGQLYSCHPFLSFTVDTESSNNLPTYYQILCSEFCRIIRISHKLPVCYCCGVINQFLVYIRKTSQCYRGKWMSCRNWICFAYGCSF